MAKSTRSYCVSIAGGTATATVQIQANGTLKQVCMSGANIAAGTYEVSLLSTSQIATAQPDTNVIARMKLNAGGATGNVIVSNIDVNVPVKAFQSVYVHCTGAGNIGEVVLMVQ